MNRILFNMKAICEAIVDARQIDVNIILGFGIAKRTRIEIVGIEFPSTDNGQPLSEGEVSILKEKAKMALGMFLSRRRLVISPMRPGPWGKIVVNAHLPCADVYPENPALVETFAGMRFLNITNAMNFVAQKRYDDKLVSEIIRTVQPTQGLESL